MNTNQEKKKPVLWNVEETECFLTIIKELQVTTLMDGKKFRTSEIFKKVEEAFKSKGYNKTHTQLLDKFKAMKSTYIKTNIVIVLSFIYYDYIPKRPFQEKYYSKYIVYVTLYYII